MATLLQVAGGYHARGQGAGREIVAFGPTPTEAEDNLAAAIERSLRLQDEVGRRQCEIGDLGASDRLPKVHRLTVLGRTERLALALVSLALWAYFAYAFPRVTSVPANPRLKLAIPLGGVVLSLYAVIAIVLLHQ